MTETLQERYEERKRLNDKNIHTYKTFELLTEYRELLVESKKFLLTTGGEDLIAFHNKLNKATGDKK